MGSFHSSLQPSMQWRSTFVAALVIDLFIIIAIHIMYLYITTISHYVLLSDTIFCFMTMANGRSHTKYDLSMYSLFIGYYSRRILNILLLMCRQHCYHSAFSGFEGNEQIGNKNIMSFTCFIAFAMNWESFRLH